MKSLTAILFALALAWTQLSAAPTPPAPVRAAHACCHCGGQMSCCAAQAASGSQRLPAVPPGAGPQRLLSLFAPPHAALALPENRAGLICPAARLSSPPMGTPLYARDCARLI